MCESLLTLELTAPPQAVGVCKRNYPIIFPLTLTLSLRERELSETPPQADGVLKEFNKKTPLSFPRCGVSIHIIHVDSPSMSKGYFYVQIMDAYDLKGRLN